jgi:hypothetical protein
MLSKLKRRPRLRESTLPEPPKGLKRKFHLPCEKTVDDLNMLWKPLEKPLENRFSPEMTEKDRLHPKPLALLAGVGSPITKARSLAPSLLLSSI